MLKSVPLKRLCTLFSVSIGTIGTIPLFFLSNHIDSSVIVIVYMYR
jgi:hypothetical protein